MSDSTRATPSSELEAKLRELWTAKGVRPERQEELLADVAAKAQHGASVGPFRIPEGDNRQRRF
jgi:hypothetical protein